MPMNKQIIPEIHIRDLDVRYKKNSSAVSGANLDLPGPKVYGLIGRNGAGKTTFLQTLVNQLNYQGRITFIESEESYPLRDNRRALGQIVFAGADASWPQDLPVHNLFHIARLRWATWNQELAEQLIQDFEIEEVKRLNAMSRGQKSAVSIVIGLCRTMPNHLAR